MKTRARRRAAEHQSLASSHLSISGTFKNFHKKSGRLWEDCERDQGSWHDDRQEGLRAIKAP